MKRAGLIVLGGLAAFLAAFALWAWAPDTDRDAMWAKYGPGDAVAEADAMRVRYRVSGPEGAPVLVMIHGTAGSLETWEPLRGRLDRTYRVIAYDQPGHGLTGPHPDRAYGYDGMADGLQAVLAAEGVDRAVLIGNSMGGWIAWRHALAAPEVVTALVLLNASGIPSDEAPDSALGFRIMRSPLGRAASQRLTPRAAIAASTHDAISREEIITDAMIDRYWEMLRYPGNRRAMADMFATERDDQSARLGDIDVPTLVIWGDEDQLVPVASAQGFADRMPDARAVIYEGVGHLPMEEVPGETARDIRAFLKTIDLRSD